jgi:hypothetical protein
MTCSHLVPLGGSPSIFFSPDAGVELDLADRLHMMPHLCAATALTELGERKRGTDLIKEMGYELEEDKIYCFSCQKPRR